MTSAPHTHYSYLENRRGQNDKWMKEENGKEWNKIADIYINEYT